MLMIRDYSDSHTESDDAAAPKHDAESSDEDDSDEESDGDSSDEDEYEYKTEQERVAFDPTKRGTSQWLQLHRNIARISAEHINDSLKMKQQKAGIDR